MPKNPPLPEIDPAFYASAAQPLPAVLPEPRAGGNYLRDPVTGALSLNPDHPTTDTPQE